MIKVLFVDDEPNILSAYRRNLRGQFYILTSDNPYTALALIRENNDIGVIVSDYNMPEMKGVEFLKKAQEILPNAVRILLTGYADIQIAMNAINEGNIFRFLTKPCDTDVMMKTLTQASNQYQLIIAEKELLEKTLKGSVKVLIDILAVANSKIFNRSILMRDLTKKILKRLKKGYSWEIEIAVLLSQIGFVGVPNELIEKKFKGVKLSTKEEELYNSNIDIARTLLKNIPRLEKIAYAISYQNKSPEDLTSLKEPFVDENFLFTTKLLKILNDYFFLLESELDEKKAIKILLDNQQKYDTMILSSLEAEILGINQDYVVNSVSIVELKEGMILAAPLLDDNNFMLLPKGTILTEIYLYKILNYSKLRRLQEPIKVLVKTN